MSEDIYTGHYTIRYSEIGADGRLKVGAIFNYLQDAAGEHAALLGVSGGDLLPRNQGWVLYHYYLAIDSFPLWKEDITIRTWKFPYRRLYELREFEIEDQAGSVIARAKSSWILIDLISRKPLRLDRNLPDQGHNHTREISFTFKKLPPVERVDREAFFTVRPHDLDFNRHANNTCFIQWALDSVSPETADLRRPQKIEATFLGEALRGDSLASQVQIMKEASKEAFLHRIINRENGKELTRLSTVWR